MKRVAAILALIFVININSNISFAAEYPYGYGAVKTNVNLVVNGDKLKTERYIVSVDGRCLVPGRSTFERLGARVDWNDSTNRIIITKDKDVIEMRIGDKFAKVNGAIMQTEVAPILANGTVMLPVRFVSESIKAEVMWEGSSRSIVLANSANSENSSADGNKNGNDSSNSGLNNTSRGSAINDLVSRGSIPSGKTVLLDAGHGGEKVGAAYFGVYEKDLNLSISLKLYNILKELGVDVRMTRFDDTDVNNYTRAYMANRMNADIFVSIHCNASPNERTTGAMTLYYPSKYDYTNMLTGYKLADYIQDELVDNLGAKDLGLIPRDKLVVLRYTKMPAIIAEVGYMSNYTELKKLLLPEYQQNIAEVLASGIINALK